MPVVKSEPAMQLDAPAFDRYEQEGYLTFPKLFSPDEIDEARAALHQLMFDLIEDARAGKTDLQPARRGTGNADGTRIVRLSPYMMLLFEHSFDPMAVSTEEALGHIRNLYHYHTDPVFERMLNSPRIKGIAEQLLGEEALHFQSMALVKPALIGSEKPWHQDDAYFKYAPVNKIIGFWMALDDATAENGCMHVLPGWHRRGGLKHYHAQDCQILPDRLNPSEAVPVELPAGGAMFFSGLLPHQTPPNRSPVSRRAVQFHFRGVSTTSVEKPEYDRAFAEADGTPASCEAALQPLQNQ